MAEVKFRKYGEIAGDSDLLNRCYNNSYVHNRLPECNTNAGVFLSSRYDLEDIYMVEKTGRVIGAFVVHINSTTGTLGYFVFTNPTSCKLSALTINQLALMHCVSHYINDPNVIDIQITTTHQLLATQILKLIPNIMAVQFNPMYFMLHTTMSNIDFDDFQKRIANDHLLKDFQYRLPK